jgi:tetratricopeptide (TPR) repeat protein
VRHYERAIELIEDDELALDSELGALLANLAAVQGALGRDEAALPLFSKAQSHLERSYGSQHEIVGRLLHESASSHLRLGKFKEARSRYERALVVRERALGPEHPDVALTLDGLGVVLIHGNDPAGAEKLLRRSIAISERAEAQEIELGLALGHLGEAQLAQQRRGEAVESFERSLGLLQQQLDASHPAVIAARNRYEALRGGAARDPASLAN